MNYRDDYVDDVDDVDIAIALSCCLRKFDENSKEYKDLDNLVSELMELQEKRKVINKRLREMKDEIYKCMRRKYDV